MSEQVLRLPHLKKKIKLSGPTIYRKIADDEFPKPIYLGKQARGWLESEIDAWIEERRRERDDRLESVTATSNPKAKGPRLPQQDDTGDSGTTPSTQQRDEGSASGEEEA